MPRLAPASVFSVFDLLQRSLIFERKWFIVSLGSAFPIASRGRERGYSTLPTHPRLSLHLASWDRKSNSETSEETAVKGNPPLLLRGEKKVKPVTPPQGVRKSAEVALEQLPLVSESRPGSHAPVSLPLTPPLGDQYHFGQGASTDPNSWGWGRSWALCPDLGSGGFRGPPLPAYLAFLPRDGVVAAPWAASARTRRRPAPRPRPRTHRAVAVPDIALRWKPSPWSRGVPRGEVADATRPHSAREGGERASRRDRAGSDGRGGAELDPGPAPGRPARPAAPPPSPTAAALGLRHGGATAGRAGRVSRVTRRRGAAYCPAPGAELEDEPVTLGGAEVEV